ncbi:hypothetical protein BH23BAC1_BH23BAC1_18780 [soil metagenome]
MNDLVKKFQEEIDEISQKFSKKFNHFSREELNWKPDPGTWSIGQIIDHLIVLNKTYFPIIKNLKEGRYQLPFVGKIGFITNSLGNLLLKSVEPDRKKKVKTFPVWESDASYIENDILDCFLIHQEDMKKLIAESEDLLANGAVISSPANKMIVYKLEKAFEIIIAHEKRHFNQAKEVLKLQKKS